MRTQLRGAAIARAVCLVQLGILALSALATGGLWGRPQAIAAVYGGLVALIPTAWFAYQLQGDRHAGQAFVNQTGEIFKESTNWSNQHSTVGSSAS